MASRKREDAMHLFQCFLEVVQPSEPNGAPGGDGGGAPWILQTYPSSYKDKEADKLKSVPLFVFPCKLKIDAVQNFSFVLTNLNAQRTFGFCRVAPNSQTALVLLSNLPWHEAFYRLLNHAAELTLSKDDGELWRFLQACYDSPIPSPGSAYNVSWSGLSTTTGQMEKKDFACHIPMDGRLPTIPENRNLTEYYNAVGIHNMLVIFSSMLYERRIIITSKRLSRLSSCIQAANALIYPMNWQHIFIPILPKHLMECLSAPMPFLIGVPSPIMERVKAHELGEAVILNADSNVITSPFNDLESLPFEVAANLKKTLKSHKDLLGESVARAFLQALVHLIGGYRDAFKFRQGEKITFNEEAFLQSRSPTLRPFLEQMLELQIFRQFVEERLSMLNTGKGFSDEFENEAVWYQEKFNQANGNMLKSQYAHISSSIKKESAALAKAVKNKMSPKNAKKPKRTETNPAMKQAVKSVKEGSRDLQHKSKSAYREMKSKMKTTTSSTHLDRDFTSGRERFGSSSSAPSSPVLSSRRGTSISSNSSANSSNSNSHSSQPSTSINYSNKSMSLANFGHNNTDLTFGRVLKYKRFDPPALEGVTCSKNGHFQHQKLSPEIMEEPKPIDLDLLSDLREVFLEKKASEAQNNATAAPPIERHLKPNLRRSKAMNPFTSSEPNLLYSSSYENLNQDSSVKTDPNPFDTTHVNTDIVGSEPSEKNIPLPPDESPNKVISPINREIPIKPCRVRKSSVPVPPPRPYRISNNNNNINVSKVRSNESNENFSKKSDLGDLIKLDKVSALEDEIVFDPLLEKSRSMMPQPPSSSMLPQITQMFSSPDHKPLKRSTKPDPFSPTEDVNPFLNPQPKLSSQQQRSQLTKSSDDLLKDYGIDFSKLTTSNNFSAAGLLSSQTPMETQPNALSLIGSSMNSATHFDPFADLDPLNQQPGNQFSSSKTSTISAPPRTKKQSWTTFE